MLDNDNIITSVSEAVEKIPTDEKDYHKWSFMVFCFAQLKHTKSRPTYIIANSRNSCLPTRIHSVQLQEPQKTFYIKFKQKNDWHMNSFIHCGSEKRVYRFPSGNKLA